MRIAIYYNLNFGGAKRVVMEHVKGLTNLGHHVDVYTIDEHYDIFDPGQYAANEYRYTFVTQKVALPLFGRIKHDFDTFFTLQNIHKHIAHDIDNRKYDIVLVHTDKLTQSPYILRFLDTTNVYYCLEPLRMVYEYSLRIQEQLPQINKIYEKINRFIRKNVDRTNARSADFSTAISYFAREYMIHAYDLYPKISYLGVDIEVFKNLNIKKKNQILFVAEKESIYGYDLAVDAMQYIPEDIRPELKILSWTKDGKKRLTDQEVAYLYSESLLTLCLSKYDTFGLIPLESMACGTPVVALQVAGYRETVIDGETGLFVDFDPRDIADKITILLQDKKLSDRMGKQGRVWVEKMWTWGKHVDHLDEILRESIKERKIR